MDITTRLKDESDRLKAEATGHLFRALAEEVPLTPESANSQVAVLIRLADMLHGISRIEGSVGLSDYHHAMRMAKTVDNAIGTIRKAQNLAGLLKDIQNL